MNQGSEFDVTVGRGVTWLQFGNDDLAEVHVGPFGARDGPVIEGIRVVLKRGVDIPVAIVDTNGEPVFGAQIGAAPLIHGGSVSSRRPPVTDENGLAVFSKGVSIEFQNSLKSDNDE